MKLDSNAVIINSFKPLLEIIVGIEGKIKASENEIHNFLKLLNEIDGIILSVKKPSDKTKGRRVKGVAKSDEDVDLPEGGERQDLSKIKPQRRSVPQKSSQGRRRNKGSNNKSMSASKVGGGRRNQNQNKNKNKNKSKAK